MLDVSALNYTIDSLYQKKREHEQNFSNTLYQRTSITTLKTNISPKKDSLYKGEIIELFNDRTKIQLLSLASNTVTSTKQIISSNKSSFTLSTKWLSKHVISLHEKYVLGIACIILFFVGAPLGALIRKGGIGLPLVIAILLFLTYHFIGIFSKNSSQDGSFNPILATWLSTAIMLPLSVFLTTRATKDRGLFEFDHIIEPIKKLFNIRSKKKQKNRSALELKLDEAILSDLDIIEDDAVTISNTAAFESKHQDYKFYAKMALVFYYIAIPLLVLHFVFKNNKFPEFASSSLQLCMISALIFIIYYVKSTFDLHKIYTYIEDKKVSKSPFLIFLGILFYPLAFYLRRNKIAEDFSLDLK